MALLRKARYHCPNSAGSLEADEIMTERALAAMLAIWWLSKNAWWAQ